MTTPGGRPLDARRGLLLQTLAAVLTASTLLAAAGALQALRERRFPPAQEAEETLYLTSGAVSRLTRGYNALAADLYWIRAIQHYGRNKIRSADVASAGPPPDYRLLYPLLDLTTTLDPRFNIAYRFGAVFLAEPPPGGPGQSDQAIALLAKGLQAQPDKWEYMQDIGFVHYWWRQDYPAAAEWFGRASQVPGAPWWLRSLAATTLAEGGDRRSSRLMWESIRESAEIDWLRRDAEKRLLQFRALDDIDALQAGVDRLAASLGTRPNDWTVLVRAGALRGVPVDPAGAPYQIDAEGRVSLSTSSPLFPLPTEPKRRSPPEPHGTARALMTPLSASLMGALAAAALFGAVIGSFLNVCIYRLPLGRSVVWPASACARCGRELSWYENVPILAWLVLRGRCRSCAEPISMQYPTIEALTAIMFAAAWWYYGPTPLLVSRLVFGCALIVLFAIDLEHHLLPNAITLPGIVAGFGFALFTEPGWLASLLGILLGAGVLYAIAEGYYLIRHEEGMGMGDVKMLGMIGAFLGWQLTILTLVMASFAGAIIGLLLIALKRGDMKYALPFGTFLALGAALSATLGPSFLEWYLSLLGAA